MIGLTGAIGAGKSAAAHAFAESGCTVIDVDALGHEALDDGEVRRGVGREFGEGVAGAVLDAEGKVDRRTLASRVFGDREALARLEGIVHPWVIRRLDHRLRAARIARPRAIVVDCALLFESGLDARCDVTVVVEAAREIRKRRVAADRGWTAEELAQREAAQLPAHAKRERADHTIQNEGGLDDLRRETAALLDRIAAALAQSGKAPPSESGGHES